MTLLAWRRSDRPSGAAVVLIHGWALDSGTFAAWEAPLAEAGMAMAACDLPGHGGSVEFTAPRGVDLADWTAQAITRDLATLGFERVGVVAFAEGGMVAAGLAVAGVAARTVLVEPDPRSRASHALEAAAALRDHRARLWSPEASDLVARARVCRAADPAMLARWLDESSWPEVSRMAAVKGPVLVAAGPGEPERTNALRLAALLRDGRVTTAATGGRALLADPGFVDVAVRFLAEPAA
jgi:pimeloyl-ACP methyl ester carboxylesterase